MDRDRMAFAAAVLRFLWKYLLQVFLLVTSKDRDILSLRM